MWGVYFGTRAVIRSLVSAASSAGLMTPAMEDINIVFVLVTSVANLVVLIYTWDGEPLKVAIFGVVCDLIMGIAMVIGISTTNLMCGREFSVDILTMRPLEAVIANVLIILISIILIRLLRPVIRWFRNVRLRHRKLLNVIIVLGIALFSSTNFTDTHGFDSTIIATCLVACLFLLPLVVYVMRTYRIQVNRQTILRQQSEMTSAYLLAADQQSGSIEAHRQLLEELKERIDRSEQHLRREELASYVAELRSYADTLRNGRYSSNFALDAVLTAYADRFDALGIDCELGSRMIAERDTKAAAISGVILNWAEGAISEDAGRHAEDTGHQQVDRTLRYNVFSQADQLIFELTMTGVGRTKFPRSMLDGYIERGDPVSCSRGNVTELKVMTQM